MSKIFLINGLLIIITFTGCSHMRNNLRYYNASVASGNYRQAAERLERCANSGSDSVACRSILQELKIYNLPTALAIAKQQDEKRDALKKEKELKRIGNLRNSKNPWDLMSLALEIQAGKISSAYPGEDSALVQQSFFEFGNCAKKNDPACMSQYAQMILYGMNALPSEKLKTTKEKALYWLNLSARYGNENARRLLLELEEPIPTPDLAMEMLQRSANSIAQENILARKEAENRQASYNAQMLEETRRQNFIMSINAFFPKTVNCVSNKIGSYTYTNCN